MRRFICFTLFAACATSLLSAKAFQGTYTMELKAADDTVVSTFWVKNGHLRQKVSNRNSPGEMILRKDKDVMLVLIPAEQKYIEVGIAPEKEEWPPVERKPVGSEGSLFRKTGETKEIHGYEAQEIIYEKDDQKVIIWATEGLGSMTFGRNPVLRRYAEAMKTVTGLHSFFALEATGYTGGDRTFQMKITDIEPKKLDSDLFDPPEGYTRLTMPSRPPGR